MKKQLRYIFAVVGLTIFAVLVYRMGLSNILAHIAEVGWWLILILIMSFIWYLAYTLAWYQFLNSLTRKIRLKELFRIKIIGEAINTLTPVNFVGGDPARAYLLRHRYPLTEAAASVVVDRTIQLMVTLIVILIGTGIGLAQLQFLPKNIKYGLPIILAIAVAFVAFIFIHQHKGLFNMLADVAKRFRIKKSFSTTTLEKFEEVDGHIQDFYKKNKKGFWLALGLHLGGRLLGIVEIFVIGRAVNEKFGFGTALLLGATAPVINFAFAFIPGALGVIESAYSAILYFLNFPASIGLTIQIIRRLRAGIWILIGFLFLGRRTIHQTFVDSRDQTPRRS